MITVADMGIKVELLTEYSVICETLERVGIINHDSKKIYPSCYCFKVEKDGNIEYRICHFKELFVLQGKPSTYSKIDQLRLKTIVYFLKKWNLITIEGSIDEILKEKIDVVKYSEKRNYKIVHKFRHDLNNTTTTEIPA
jgi:hypothetical protein